MSNKKKQSSKREMRSLRIRQIAFLIVSGIIVLAMVLGMIAPF